MEQNGRQIPNVAHNANRTWLQLLKNGVFYEENKLNFDAVILTAPSHCKFFIMNKKLAKDLLPIGCGYMQMTMSNKFSFCRVRFKFVSCNVNPFLPNIPFDHPENIRKPSVF